MQPRGDEIGAGSIGGPWKILKGGDIMRYPHVYQPFVDLCGSNYVSVFALSGSSIARDCCETGVFLSDPELGLHPNLVGSLMCIN